MTYIGTGDIGVSLEQKGIMFLETLHLFVTLLIQMVGQHYSISWLFQHWLHSVPNALLLILKAKFKCCELFRILLCSHTSHMVGWIMTVKKTTAVTSLWGNVQEGDLFILPILRVAFHTVLALHPMVQDLQTYWFCKTTWLKESEFMKLHCVLLIHRRMIFIVGNCNTTCSVIHWEIMDIHLGWRSYCVVHGEKECA